jgi:hypothetical protein
MEFISRSRVMIIVSDTFLELSSSAQSRKELTPSTGLEWSGDGTQQREEELIYI